MKIVEIIFCIFLLLCFVAGVLGVIIEKIRTGKGWIGQGYGRK